MSGNPEPLLRNRPVLGSIVAISAGWAIYNLVWIAYAWGHRGDFDLDWSSFLASIAMLLPVSGIFTLILWIALFLPLYLYIPRQSFLWRWPAAAVCGLAVGALVPGCLHYPELAFSSFPVIRGACASGAACLVASLSYPHFNPDTSPQRREVRVLVRIWLSAAIFVFAMIAATIGYTYLWDYQVAGRVYVCTDSGSMDYIIMDWASINNGHWPAIVVKQIHQNVTMNDPDEIIEGWSVPRLWALWYSLLASSILLSIMAAGFPWWRDRRRIGESEVQRPLPSQ
jgi:hypothetical protein